MGVTSVDPESLCIAVSTVREAAACVGSVSLPVVDAGEGSATATLGRLSTALGSFPDVFVGQVALAAVAMALTITDAVTADQAV